MFSVFLSYKFSRDFSTCFSKGEIQNIKKEINFDAMMPSVSVMDALDGFMFVLSQEGQCLFVSPNVAQYLGITQVIYIHLKTSYLYCCLNQLTSHHFFNL